VAKLSEEDNYPSKGDTIRYIYTDSQHKNPLHRVMPVESTHESRMVETNTAFSYDKEKYREMLLDAAETVLGYFGFDRTAHGNKKSSATARKWRWLHELREERERDIRTEVSSH
jgi:hypothetical protein